MSKSQLYLVPAINEPLVENHPQEDDNHKYGNGGGGDDMLQRIKDLEKDMHVIKTDLAVMKSNYATKADVSDAKFSIIVWVVGAIFIAQLLPPIISAIKAAL
ncbi:hypothetical protein [Citrobacter amalonaticus]|uniref:hypothetical protein n=1 Tax=Citrobacter amalonaticus TaxID=35703 RepID=UPI001908626F|nr:hypothetical protein [Citrobacter amalonaticus]MBJ9866291.1 hypothetical protein [Citrobacter amalonaticus]